jgi:hypothetical protein
MNDRIRTARTTGVLYLALALFGMFGFLIARGNLYVEGDAAATVANLVGKESLARFGLAAEMGAVVAQVLVALWFFRLFRDVDSFAAGALAVFGAFNAGAILVAAGFTAAAIGMSTGDLQGLAGGQPSTALLMMELNGVLWGIGQLFFGLWLIPMGRLVVTSGYMPRLLGRLLVAGGVVYIAIAFQTYLWPDAPAALADVLVLVPTAGELWMIGCLLTTGLRRKAASAELLDPVEPPSRLVRAVGGGRSAREGRAAVVCVVREGSYGARCSRRLFLDQSGRGSLTPYLAREGF